jgi:hypothetical protein
MFDVNEDEDLTRLSDQIDVDEGIWLSHSLERMLIHEYLLKSGSSDVKSIIMC